MLLTLVTFVGLLILPPNQNYSIKECQETLLPSFTLSLSVCVGSVAFTNGGRYRDNGAYGKKLYGAFTGPM